jgi:predicted amidohydrolase YtcJ
MVLIVNAQIGGRPGLDVRVGHDSIKEIGPGLRRRSGEDVVDAAGGAVIPGLHDHHVHLRAAVAARQSTDVAAVADQRGFDAIITAAAAKAEPGRWLRVTGLDEHRAGKLDRQRLDALTGQVPARVQHRSGAMWVLNSTALQAVGAADCDQVGLERDDDGVPTGRMFRLDRWLHDRLPAAAHADVGSGLVAYAERAAVAGITGFTDATPGRDARDVDFFGAMSDAIRQRLVLMAPPEIRLPDRGGCIELGAHKVILDDTTLPSADELAALIAGAHRQGRAVAVHCVTAEQLVVCTAAFEQAGRIPPLADRIEHAGVVPPGYAGVLARLGLTVVTQPAFVRARGDGYREDVPAAEQDWLYPCASLLSQGVPVAGSTDAPFGPPDPWECIAAAVSRRTASGHVLVPGERIAPGAALRLFLADPIDPRRTRSVSVGQRAELCVLRAPLADVLSLPSAAVVRATVARGQLIFG